MSVNKLYNYVILILLLIPLSEIRPQVQHLILADTTIATTATFIGTNSITAGPNFTISNTGNATFLTGGQIYLRTGVSVVSGGTFKTVLDTTLVGVEYGDEKIIPENFSLLQNYPNPFNPSTKIKYAIPQSSMVVLKVIDILGNEVETLVNEEKQAGSYELSWYAENLPTGVYFYQLKVGNFVETKKMVLMK